MVPDYLLVINPTCFVLANIPSMKHMLTSDRQKLREISVFHYKSMRNPRYKPKDIQVHAAGNRMTSSLQRSQGCSTELLSARRVQAGTQHLI